MRRFFRWFVAIPIAALVTATLFLLVLNAIAPRPFIYQSPDDPEKIVFFDMVECMCRPWITIIEGPAYPDQEDSSNAWTRSDKAASEAPRVPEEKPVLPELIEEGLHYCSGSSETLYRHIAPLYPKACVQKRAEGAVIVQFDITAEGKVMNVSIVESADRCFNSTVLKLVSGWRYATMCNADGKPVARYDQQATIRFVLED